MRVCSFLIAMILTTGTAWAQDNKETPISPERPGFTNGTDTVAPGRYQLEYGYVSDYANGDRQHALGNNSTLRVPIRANLEARAVLPDYLWAGGNSRGFADAAVSVKYRFLEASAARRAVPSLAFIGNAILPTGKSGFRGDGVQPGGALEAQWSLTDRYSISADVVYSRVRQDDARYDQWGGAVSLNIALSPRLGTFAEIYRVSDTGVGDAHDNVFDTGLTYALGANTALDINAGVGIFGTRNTYFVGTGIARRW